MQNKIDNRRAMPHGSELCHHLETKDLDLKPGPKCKRLRSDKNTPRFHQHAQSGKIDEDATLPQDFPSEHDDDEALLKLAYLSELRGQIRCSSKYRDEKYEYRHVIVPKVYMDFIPNSYKNRLLLEKEWRRIGITQSKGWIHYLIHRPEPHIYVFRRPICKVESDSGDEATQ